MRVEQVGACVRRMDRYKWESLTWSLLMYVTVSDGCSFSSSSFFSFFASFSRSLGKCACGKVQRKDILLLLSVTLTRRSGDLTSSSGQIYVEVLMNESTWSDVCLRQEWRRESWSKTNDLLLLMNNRNVRLNINKTRGNIFKQWLSLKSIVNRSMFDKCVNARSKFVGLTSID